MRTRRALNFKWHRIFKYVFVLSWYSYDAYKYQLLIVSLDPIYEFI